MFKFRSTLTHFGTHQRLQLSLFGPLYNVVHGAKYVFPPAPVIQSVSHPINLGHRRRLLPQSGRQTGVESPKSLEVIFDFVFHRPETVYKRRLPEVQ